MSKLLHPLSLSFLVPFFFFTISMAAEPNSTYPTCPSYDCGHLTISYPFWRIDHENTTQFCGYEGFGINCSTIGNRNLPFITLADDLYYVDKINYDFGIIILVDADVSTPVVGDLTCPRVQHNIDLPTLPLNFSSLNVNLSFHFNCSEIPNFATPIPCLDFPAKKSCFNIVNTSTENFDWGGYNCEEEVVTTVMRMEENRPDLQTMGILRSALRGGFELMWRRVEDCVGCEESHGRCGYNYDTKESMCFCSDGKITSDRCNKGARINFRLKLVIAFVGSASLMIVLICIVKFSKSIYTTLFKHRTEDDRSVEAFIMQYGSLITKRYKYVDIKKMTNSFEVKLGQGGFGSVFKGKLSDGRPVAVKVLNSSKASGQEFINEVASIGRTSHVNIVALLGFCFEYSKRALIYEFMPNGSLEKFIDCDDPLKKSKHIEVNKLYEVALGIARGLDYLHRGCNTRILHLDIKPHNILLDEDYCPKIADFGLAKLYSRKESIVSMLEARGTIGYIAPEVFMRNFGGVSHKSDVYSYGMMILEIVGGRKNVDAGVYSERNSDIYFPNWIYNRLEKDDFLLKGVTTKEDNNYARKLTIVGLWCIQTNPMKRPSIKEVIEMLEGSMEALEVPPKPFFSPPQSPATTFNTLESDSGIIITQQ